jgi:hypothetical protein
MRYIDTEGDVVKRGWIVGIIGMCVVVISVGVMAFGHYLSEEYIDYQFFMPPPNHNPELHYLGIDLLEWSPSFIFIGTVLMAIGLTDVWRDERVIARSKPTQ